MTRATMTTLLTITTMFAVSIGAVRDAHGQGSSSIVEADTEADVEADAEAPIERESGGAVHLEWEDAVPNHVAVEPPLGEEGETENDQPVVVAPVRPAPTYSLGLQQPEQQEADEEAPPLDSNRRLRNAGLTLMLVSFGTQFTLSMVSMPVMGPMSFQGLIPVAGGIMNSAIFGFDGGPLLIAGLLMSVGQFTGLIMTCVGGRRMQRAREARSGRIRNLAVLPSGPTGQAGLTVSGQF